MNFRFEPKLFEHRNTVMEKLSSEGIQWFSQFGTVDLDHEIYGLEVCGIHERSDAKRIGSILRKLFPDWLHFRIWYEDHNLGELGWKVLISRDPETYDDSWKQS